MSFEFWFGSGVFSSILLILIVKMYDGYVTVRDVLCSLVCIPLGPVSLAILSLFLCGAFGAWLSDREFMDKRIW